MTFKIMFAALGLVGLMAGAPAMAQDTPAPTLKKFQAVQAEVVPGEWDPCTVTEVFQGAYEVTCNHTKKMVRDTQVRLPGGQPPAKTAAMPVTEPFARGMVVLASPISMPDRWQLCVVMSNRVAESGSYGLACAGNNPSVAPKWVRVDPDAPQ